VYNLQRIFRRCVRWCQSNICITHTTAHALVLRTPVKCTQHSLQKNAHIYMHTHICIRIHIHKNTHVHLWHRSNTQKNGYWDSQSMHKYAYTYIYTCIYMHTYSYTYTHAYIYICTCQYIYIHAYIYTPTYNMYICTHESTSETTVRQRLHGKPDLRPRSSALLPVRCNPEEDIPPWSAAQLPVHEERRISAEQPQPTAAHRTITTARRPDHIRLSAQVRSWSTQFMARPKLPAWPWRPLKTKSCFCHFGAFSRRLYHWFAHLTHWNFAPSSPFFSSWWQKDCELFTYTLVWQCSPSTSSRQPQTTHVFADSRIALWCHALRICVAHAPPESCPFSLLVHWAFRACFRNHLPLLHHASLPQN